MDNFVLPAVSSYVKCLCGTYGDSPGSRNKKRKQNMQILVGPIVPQVNLINKSNSDSFHSMNLNAHHLDLLVILGKK